MSVDEAKKELDEHGYQTHNLWHIDDVMLQFECDENEAMSILEQALTNDWIVEQIFYVINDIATEEGFKRKEEI